jgi:hypothetical protein
MHSGVGAGLGPLGPPVPRRAHAAWVQHDQRGGCVVRRRARVRPIQKQFDLTFFESNFLQILK